MVSDKFTKMDVTPNMVFLQQAHLSLSSPSLQHSLRRSTDENFPLDLRDDASQIIGAQSFQAEATWLSKAEDAPQYIQKERSAQRNDFAAVALPEGLHMH